MESELPQLVAKALGAVLWISAPAVLAAALAATIAGFIQAMTQVHDATLAYLPRLLGLSAALALGGPWMVHRAVSLTGELWQSFP